MRRTVIHYPATSRWLKWHGLYIAIAGIAFIVINGGHL